MKDYRGKYQLASPILKFKISLDQIIRPITEVDNFLDDIHIKIYKRVKYCNYNTWLILGDKCTIHYEDRQLSIEEIIKAADRGQCKIGYNYVPQGNCHDNFADFYK